MEDIKKSKIKKLFSDLLFLEDEKKDLGESIKEILLKNEKYQKLINDKDLIEKQIEEIEDSVVQDIKNKQKAISENIKLIKEDVSKDLECKKKIVNQIYKYYKVKNNGEDQLKEVSEKFIELFEI